MEERCRLWAVSVRGTGFLHPATLCRGGEDFPIGYSNKLFSFIRDLTGDGKNEHCGLRVSGQGRAHVRQPGRGGWGRTLAGPSSSRTQLIHEATSLIDRSPAACRKSSERETTRTVTTQRARTLTQPWTWRSISRRSGRRSLSVTGWAWAMSMATAGWMSSRRRFGMSNLPRRTPRGRSIAGSLCPRMERRFCG